MYLNEYQNLLRSAKDMKELCNVITQGTDQYLLKSIEMLRKKVYNNKVSIIFGGKL